MRTVADIIRQDLCCGCGICAVACPAEAIHIAEHTKTGILGPIVDPERCTSCSACLAICPGRAVDSAGLNRQVFGKLPADIVIGNWDAIYVAWSTNMDIRLNSSSGGIATTLLCDLIDRGEIDGAVVVSTNPSNPLRPNALLASTPDQVKAACGSKYCPVSLDSGLAEVKKQPGRYAVVGLPCHLHGIRMLETRSEVLRERVVLHLGLMCGRNSTFLGTEYFLRNKGIEPGSVRTISYRAKGWPGQICVTLRDGSESCFKRSTSDKSFTGQRLFHSAFHFDFIQPRCLTCFDTLAAFADISLGDAWLPEIKREEKIGKSIIITRTAIGSQIVNSLLDREKIQVVPLDIARLESRNLSFARGFRQRARLLRMLGKAVPQYQVAGETNSKTSPVANVVHAITLLPFIPSLFSHVRALWPLITFLGYIRQLFLVCSQGVAKCLKSSQK